jgi:hypothetical protein
VPPPHEAPHALHAPHTPAQGTATSLRSGTTAVTVKPRNWLAVAALAS